MDDYFFNGIHYIRLISSCPICLERGIRFFPTYWRHDTCNGNIHIGDDCSLSCNTCGKVISIDIASFDCPGHSGIEDNYIRMDGRGLYAKKEYILDSIQFPNDSQWLKKFSESIYDAFNGFKH